MHTPGITDRIATYDAYREFVERPENQSRRFELWHGVIREMPSPTPLHQLIAFYVAVLLHNFVLPRGLGVVFTDNNACVIAPGLVLQPDAAFIAAARLPAKRYEIAPDLVIEVFSPSNIDMAEKIELYLRHGTRLAWVVYAGSRTVCVYRPNADGSVNSRLLSADDQIDVGEVLPGFAAHVRDFFPTLPVAPQA
jgi:Uma2 family endonuclease